MATMSRRRALEALLGGAVTLGRVSAPTTAKAYERGCVLGVGRIGSMAAGLGFGRGGERLVDTTGDPTLDRELGREIVTMSGLFQEQPGFGFVRDRGAFATQETIVPGTWGTVGFGQVLFEELYSPRDRGLTVLGVLAHEFGHISQMRSGTIGHLEGRTVKRVELHADFLAGFYIGLRKREDPSLSVRTAGRAFEEIGDNSYYDRNHHGTPEERYYVTEQGFKIGIENRLRYDEVFSWGVEFILDNFWDR